MKFVLLVVSVFSIVNLNGQVTPQNGSANYEIPIFSFSDSKSGLGTGVSLSYSSGNGLVVSSKASNTGQNWSLVAGGVIFRKQNGEADDQNSTGIFPVMEPVQNYKGYNTTIAVYDIDQQNSSVGPYSRDYINNYFPNGYLYSEFPLDMVEETQTNGPLSYYAPRELAVMARFQPGMDLKWKLSRRALADRQQDVFVFNCNGKYGEFVIGKDGIPVMINGSKFIITKTTADLTAQNIQTRINGFTITDENGVIYKFSAYELSEIMKFVEISNEGSSSFKKYISSGEPTGKYTIQKWLLTEVENPITLEKIIFQYDDYNLDIITDKSLSYQFTEGQSVESVQVYEQRAKGQLKRIKKIILPNGHKVEFFYEASRHDIPTDMALSKVKVTYNNEEAYTYNMNYSFFLKKEIKPYGQILAETDKKLSRLCLTSLNKSIGSNSEPSYRFSYYTGIENNDPKNIVPPYDCVAQDHWGYYNMASIVDPTDLNPTKEVLKNLMLNNATYREPSSGAAKLGLLKSVEMPLGGKMTFEYEQNDAKDADNTSLTKTNGGIRVFKTIFSDGVNSANDIITNYNYKLADGSTSGWGYETPTYLNRRQIKIWNASNNEGYTQNGLLVNNLHSKYLNFKAQISPVKFAIGIFNSIAKIVDINPLSSYATFVIGKLIDGLFVLFNPNDYVWSNNYNFLPFQVQNPIGVNYSRVEVVNTSLPGGNGKIVNEFIAPVNIRSEIPAFVLPYSQKQRFANWKYGLLSKSSVYNQSGDLVKEQTNSYNIISNSLVSENHKSCKVETIRPESVWCWVGVTTNNIPLSDFSWEYYYPITGRAELISSIEKNYSQSGLLSMNEVTSSYNNDFLENISTTTASNGDVVKVKKYYTNDYNNISPAIIEMKARNMLVVPISIETWLTKPNGNEYLLDGTINEFEKLSNGEIKIKKVYKLRTKQPLLKSLIGEHNPAVLVRNATYFKEQVNFNYDNNGLLLETTTPELQVSTKIYDYNDRIVTAEVVNAAKFEVAYSSFEADQKGGWDYNIANTQMGESVTGKKFFSFPNTSTTITRTLVSAKANRLSFWSKGIVPAVSFSGLTLSPFKTIENPVSGWTYREYMFTGSGTISIGINADGASYLDELRTCPIDARMATVAYDPKVGKITECDVNNRLVYYEYDGLSRLQYVRDDRKNILKKICYNYAGEPENCLDVTDLSPQWRATGNTRCQVCPFNGLYNSGIKEKEEIDVNPLSPSYGSPPRWVVDPGGSCPSPANWVITDTYCHQLNTPPFGNSGYQAIVRTDMNPCSQTTGQTQTTLEFNAAACPPTPICNPACNEPSYKCINGVCVLGTWEVLRVKKLGKTGPWECTYVYCFPDGTFSNYNQIVTSSTACTVTCF